MAVSNRERFLRACRCEKVDHPPVWLMRQAGRVLPEYRALKEKYSFIDLVRTPDLAGEVTLQPIRRFDFDAAIIFSDILVVAEALGVPYHFSDEGGIRMESAVSTGADVDRLQAEDVSGRLAYVGEAIKLVRAALSERTALIGFAGSPWTVACFLLEGAGSREFVRAREMFYQHRGIFDRLCEKLTRATTEYLRLQIAAGAEAVQIFDTLGGLLSADAFEVASAQWIRRIIAELGAAVPVIVFSKGAHGHWPTLMETGANVLGFDWTACLADYKGCLPPNMAIQGNLDPVLLCTTPELVASETRRLLEEMRGRPGHIVNLGHGVPPTARLENIESLVYTVRRFA